MIDWSKDPKDIYNQIRGLNPYPAAWCLLKNGDEELNVKVYSVEAIECNHDYPIGMLISGKQELKVAAKNGLILLNEIKLPSKKKMDVKSLLNGFEFDTEAKML